MIVRFAKYLSQLPPVFVDGFLYVMVQTLTVLSTQFGTDEAAKYIEPTLLFWIKIVIGELAAGFLALKMFRSTTFAEHRASKTGDTNFLARIQTGSEPPKP